MEKRMTITAITGDWAGRYVDRESVTLILSEGTAAADIPEILGIPRDEAGMIAVNGKAVPREFRLSDKDIVKIFPAIIAG